MSDRASRIAIAVVAAVFFAAALSGCAHAPPPARFTPAADKWSTCETACAAEGATFLGVLLPSIDGPAVCTCAVQPKPLAWGM